MKELVGICAECYHDVYCKDGFFDGIVLEDGTIRCFACQKNDTQEEG